MHLVTYLHPRLPTDSAEEPKRLCTVFIAEHDATAVATFSSENAFVLQGPEQAGNGGMAYALFLASLTQAWHVLALLHPVVEIVQELLLARCQIVWVVHFVTLHSQVSLNVIVH